MTLGEQIKAGREAKNLSQEDLAERLEVSRQAVSKWENDLAVPRGVNKEMLMQILEMEIAGENTESDEGKRTRIMAVTGWALAFVLPCCAVGNETGGRGK